MINLWNVTNGKIQLNEDELVTIESIKAFNELYKCLSTDADRLKIFMYVWHMADYRSLGVIKGYDYKELHEFAIKQSGVRLPFIVTDVIKFAIDVYRDLQEDVTEEQFKYVKISQHNTAKVLKALNKSIGKTLLKAETSNLTTAEMDTIIDIQTKINKISDELPKRIKSLQELEATLIAHRTKAKELRGRKEYRQSMDSDRV